MKLTTLVNDATYTYTDLMACPFCGAAQIQPENPEVTFVITCSCGLSMLRQLVDEDEEREDDYESYLACTADDPPMTFGQYVDDRYGEE